MQDVPHLTSRSYRKKKRIGTIRHFPEVTDLDLLDIQSLHLYIEDIEKVLYAICYLFCDQN